MRCKGRHLRNLNAEETGCGKVEKEDEEEPRDFNHSPPVSEAPALLRRQRGMKP